MATLGVIGVGSIGSVLARGFQHLGHDVRVNDINEERVASLPFEAASKRELAAWADFIVIAVPTPTREDGGDVTAVDAALTPLEEHDTDATIIIRSTMPPGETQRLAVKHRLPLVYAPEFLRDRSDVDDFFNPDRIVLAGPPEERAAARELFADEAINCERVIETSKYITAEIGKEAHNAYFATKVSFANQMRLIAEQEGADPQRVMDIITTDSRNTSSHLDPLLGPYGGKCLPKDTRALTLYGEQQGAPVPLLSGVIDLNEIARKKYENVEIEGSWPDVTAQGD